MVIFAGNAAFIIIGNNNKDDDGMEYLEYN